MLFVAMLQSPETPFKYCKVIMYEYEIVSTGNIFACIGFLGELSPRYLEHCNVYVYVSMFIFLLFF